MIFESPSRRSVFIYPGITPLGPVGLISFSWLLAQFIFLCDLPLFLVNPHEPSTMMIKTFTPGPTMKSGATADSEIPAAPRVMKQKTDMPSEVETGTINIAKVHPQNWRDGDTRMLFHVQCILCKGD